MDKYNITGMSCAACSARVEKAVCALDGVTSCSVNLLTNSMIVEGTADEESIVTAVTDAGYGAVRAGMQQKQIKSDDGLSGAHEIKLMKTKTELLEEHQSLMFLKKLPKMQLMKNLFQKKILNQR